MSSGTIYRADEVDGLVDSLPGRQYKQKAPFWVFVALQDWLREEGNANLLAYDSNDSVCIHPYPKHTTGERLTPREVYYLFNKPPEHVASQLPRCYCPALEDDGSAVVRSFVVRKEDSPRHGEYSWLTDVYNAPLLDVAPAGTGMLAHIESAERKDMQRSQKREPGLRSITAGEPMDVTIATRADVSTTVPEVAAATIALAEQDIPVVSPQPYEDDSSVPIPNVVYPALYESCMDMLLRD